MTEQVNILQARDAIEKRWLAAWGDTTAYTFDNEKLLPPAVVAANAASADIDSWVRLVVRHIISNQETIGAEGNRKFERQGKIVIQVFTPVDKGTADADTLVIAAGAVFEGTRFEGLVCYAATPIEIGVAERWYQTNVEVPFTYYDTK